LGVAAVIGKPGLFPLRSLRYSAAMPSRDDLLFDLQMALGKIPPATSRDLAKRQLPGDELAEKIVPAPVSIEAALPL
jgi:hypothetical protein